MMLEDLLNQGHSDSESKRGAGIKAFQVRVNSDFDSRCYHIIRCDGSVTDFSYRKCLDNIVSLPNRFKTPNGKRFGVKKKRKRRGGCWGCQDNAGKDSRSSCGNAGDDSVAYFRHMKSLHKSKIYRAEKRKKVQR
ncbi:hypothetical protein KP509_1Z027100 [Ceratopteris richardii]|nr:hypothetical protein KP509_1Z027100 [Ceratopteris richardii]